MNSRLAKYVKSKFIRMAGDLMDNPQGLKFKLEKAAEKLKKGAVADALGVYLEDLKTLIRMVAAWLSRKYTGLEKQTILYTIVAIIYFVTPTDFVPDFLLGLGFVDDIAVISWVLGIIKEDLVKFKKWESEKIVNKSNKTTNKKVKKKMAEKEVLE